MASQTYNAGNIQVLDENQGKARQEQEHEGKGVRTQERCHNIDHSGDHLGAGIQSVKQGVGGIVLAESKAFHGRALPSLSFFIERKISISASSAASVV